MVLLHSIECYRLLVTEMSAASSFYARNECVRVTSNRVTSRCAKFTAVLPGLLASLRLRLPDDVNEAVETSGIDVTDGHQLQIA